MTEQQLSNAVEIQPNSKSSQKRIPKLLGRLVLVSISICIIASLFVYLIKTDKA